MFEIRKHLAEISQSNWSACKAGLASDAVYEEVATHVRVKGADEYLAVIQRWKRAFPDLTATVLDTFVAGDRIVAEVQWEGTHSGALEGPLGTIAPTNKRGVIQAAIVATVQNDKLVELHQYFDVLTLLGNLGIAPVAGAPPKSAQAGGGPGLRHP